MRKRVFHLLILGVMVGALSALLGWGNGQWLMVQAQPESSTGPVGPGPATIPSALTTLDSTPVTTYYVHLPLIIHTPFSEFVLGVVERTNYYRAQASCPALSLNQQLANAAQGHSTDMALNDFFSHTGSDGSSPINRVKEAGYTPKSLAENIAAGQTTPEAVVEDWMSSPDHRNNILNCDFQDIGVGYYYLANDTGQTNYHYYWTQDLATPQ